MYVGIAISYVSYFTIYTNTSIPLISDHAILYPEEEEKLKKMNFGVSIASVKS